MIKRPTPKQRRSKHLCADAGYRGKNAMKVILAYGYIPHVVSHKSEAQRKKRDPKKKARCWVVEACHGWFNRFRKLLVRYEKLEHTQLRLLERKGDLILSELALLHDMLPARFGPSSCRSFCYRTVRKPGTGSKQ